MKLLTIVIPSYNSEAFLEDCLSSLLIGLDDKLEVIVINDGSKDNTSKIAHSYASKYPFIQVVDKENGGHGSGVNVGIALATGLYFKVLDSDDSLDKDGLINLINYIEKHYQENNLPDLYLTNYYSVDNTDSNDRVLVNIGKRVKKKNIVAPFSNMKKVNPPTFFMMHQTYIKTSVLQDNEIKVLEHTFYEDNELLLAAFLHSDTFCFLDKPIYLYTVGRKGQSISFEKMSENYLHQMRVFDSCSKMVNYETLKNFTRYKRRVILAHFYIISFLCFFYSHVAANKERRKNYKEILKEFKRVDRSFYKKVYHRSPITLLRLIPIHSRGRFCRVSYHLYSKNLGWS